MHPELVISSPADVKKLVGWEIRGVAIVMDGPDPMLDFVVRHPAAECLVKVRVKPVVAFARSGNILQANLALTIRADDLPVKTFGGGTDADAET